MPWDDDVQGGGGGADPRKLYHDAYRAVRLQRIVDAAIREWDYTMYDGWREYSDGVNKEGQTRGDWMEEIDLDLQRQAESADDAKEKLDALYIDPLYLQIAQRHYAQSYMPRASERRFYYQMLQRRSERRFAIAGNGEGGGGGGEAESHA